MSTGSFWRNPSSNLDRRFKAVRDICNIFSFLWSFQTLSIQDLNAASQHFSYKYINDVPFKELNHELINLKSLYPANFGTCQLKPLDLLNAITSKSLHAMFPNVCIALRIFCTLPVTVASGERSFSRLKLIKNFLRTNMSQQRLQDLAILCLESDVARIINFDTVIDEFAAKKARKKLL